MPTSYWKKALDILDSGIEIVARPPGKEPRSISLLSGGEKTLTCVALLLAIFRSRPSPFCVLDEVDAALDEANIERFIGVLQEFLTWTQFIVVTHSKKTMTCANTLYGVTMQESAFRSGSACGFEDVSETGEILNVRDEPSESDEDAGRVVWRNPRPLRERVACFSKPGEGLKRQDTSRDLVIQPLTPTRFAHRPSPARGEGEEMRVRDPLHRLEKRAWREADDQEQQRHAAQDRPSQTERLFVVGGWRMRGSNEQDQHQHDDPAEILSENHSGNGGRGDRPGHIVGLLPQDGVQHVPAVELRRSEIGSAP